MDYCKRVATESWFVRFDRNAAGVLCLKQEIIAIPFVENIIQNVINNKAMTDKYLNIRNIYFFTAVSIFIKRFNQANKHIPCPTNRHRSSDLYLYLYRVF